MAIGTGTALLAGAAVSAIGGMAASRAQSKAAKQAGQVSERQYQQTRADLAPWRTTGSSAVSELSALYGLPGKYPTIDQEGNPVPNEPVMTNPGIINPDTITPINRLANFGRFGDNQLAHVASGEMVVPREVAGNPRVQNALMQGFGQAGMDPNRYMVGGRNSVNPRTGLREYFSTYDGNEDEQGSGFDGYGSAPGGLGDRNYGGGDWRPGIPTNPFMTNPGTINPDTVTPLTSAPTEGYYSQDAAINRFYDSPDYRLAFDEGAGAIERSAAARGGLFSGNTGTALMRYGMDYGGNLYGNYYNRLANLAGLGQNAAAQTGNVGAQVAGQRGNALLAGGNARAAGYEGIGNAINSGLSNYLLYDYLGG